MKNPIKLIVMMSLGIGLLSMTIISCGSGGDANSPQEASGSQSPTIPNVAGNYTCDSGCNGRCIFENEITVIQSTANIILRSESGDSTGNIDAQGDFTVHNDRIACSGTFINNTAVADCTIEGTICQTVTYTKD